MTVHITTATASAARWRSFIGRWCTSENLPERAFSFSASLAF
jgi:hypothetical protein